MDDIQVLVHGPKGSVESRADRVAHDMVMHLELDAEMPVNTSKIMLVATDRKLAVKIARKRVRFRKAVKSNVRNLGIDYNAGKGARQSHRATKIKEIRRKANRIRILGRHGREAALVAQAGLGPTALFGVSVTGIPLYMLRAVRQQYHKVVTRNPRGRSLTWDLSCHTKRLDPAYQSLAAPIAMLAVAVTESLLGRGMLAELLDVAARRVRGVDHRADRLVSGPVSAAILAMRRLGWSEAAEGVPWKWTTEHGHAVDFSVLEPHAVRTLAHIDVETWIWREAAARRIRYSHLQAPPFIPSFLRGGKSRLDRAEANMLHAWCAGAYRFGSRCVCDQTFDSDEEVFTHFAWSCPATWGFRI